MKCLRNNLIERFLYALILLIGLFLLFFVAYKASITSFTHDESFTYLKYVRLQFLEILSFKNSYTNNHILNTILMKYSELIFGTSEFTLRLPNISSFFVYLLFTFFILKIQNRILMLPIFLLMVLNPFLLDFFGLARGYGLSFALMIVSIYYFLRSLEKNGKSRDLWFFNMSALLAVLANFTLLNFYVAILVTFNIILLINSKLRVNQSGEKLNLLKLNKVNIISIFISIAVLYMPIKHLVKVNLLSFGGNSLFKTFTSQVYKACDNNSNPGKYSDVISYFIIAIIVISFLIVLINYLMKNKEFFKQFKGLIAVNFILIIILLETVVQHYLLHNDYFKGRFALFLYPLIVLNFGFLMYYLLSGRLKYPAIIFCFIIVIPTVMNFYSNANIVSYKDWRYDQSTKQMLTELENHVISSNGKNENVQLGINWLFEPTINFYRITHDLKWLEPPTREGLKENDDYIYIFDKDFKTTGKPIFTSEKIKASLYNSWQLK